MAPLTPGERSALQWLVAVAALGSGAQLYRHWHHSGEASPAATESLSRQLVAVDSAQRAGRQRSRSGPRRARPRVGRPKMAAPDSGAASSGASGAFPVPPARRSKREALPRLLPVDVDLVDAKELESLPRIGPALAARIVADRAAKGPYGSIEELQRVRGIGPRLAEVLRGHVTFSGKPRPSSVPR